MNLNNTSYFKYLKYKKKYIDLKNLIGGMDGEALRIYEEQVKRGEESRRLNLVKDLLKTKEIEELDNDNLLEEINRELKRRLIEEIDLNYLNNVLTKMKPQMERNRQMQKEMIEKQRLEDLRNKQLREAKNSYMIKK